MQVAHALLAWHIQKPGPHSQRTLIRAGRTASNLQPAEEQQLQPAEEQQANPLPESTHRMTGMQTEDCRQKACRQKAADCNAHRMAQQHESVVPLHHSSAAQQYHGHNGSAQHLTHPNDLLESSALQDGLAQTSHRSKSDQMIQHSSPSQHSQASDNEVELSCSLDEEMLSELDLQSSAISQLCPAVDSDAASSTDNLPVQCQGDGHMGSADMRHLSSPALSVKLGKGHKACQQVEMLALEQEMAVSPFAHHGRQKQAKTGSMRCLKF